ncbi:hypothetical protein [Streptomyces natalensis]|nr:hypothetical protein [Streptomyces natalensis]
MGALLPLDHAHERELELPAGQDFIHGPALLLANVVRISHDAVPRI